MATLSTIHLQSGKECVNEGRISIVNICDSYPLQVKNDFKTMDVIGLKER